MCLIRPVWFDYAVWDYSDLMYPKFIGLREDTPNEIRKAYEDYQRMMEEGHRKGYNY